MVTISTPEQQLNILPLAVPKAITDINYIAIEQVIQIFKKIYEK